MEDKDGHGGPDIGVKGFGWCGELEICVNEMGWVWRES